METRDNLSPSLETERPVDDAASRQGRLKSDAKAAVEREVHDARDRLSAASSDLRSEASGAVGTISSLVSEQAERRKGEAADHLSSFAQTVRRASDDLGANDNSMSARLVQEAAHSLERLSGGLQSRSVSDITRSVTTFGRENPTAFLAGCLLAGVAIGRFLTASSDRVHHGRRDGGDDWQSGRERGAENRWEGETGIQEPIPAAGPAAGSSGGMGAGSAGGYAGGAAGQAGTFGSMVAPSSAERAPGDLDAQGTMIDDVEPTMPSDSGLGGLAGEGSNDVPKPYVDRGLGTGGRDGDL